MLATDVTVVLLKLIRKLNAILILISATFF